MKQRSRRQYALQLMASVCKDKPRDQWDQAIREAYPWGPRTNWPYKAWLQARREFLGKAMPEALPEPKAVEGQEALFGGSRAGRLLDGREHD